MLMTGHNRERTSSGLKGCIITCAFVAALLLATAYPTALQAHPPKDVTLSFDTQKQVLSVTITHPSFFPTKHYIKSVSISVNGKAAKSSNYSEQPSADTITYTYPVNASPGDEISVVVRCNMFGSSDASIRVPEK